MRAMGGVAVALLAACGCRSDDAERARLEAQIDQMSGELAELRRELANQRSAPDASPAPAPDPTPAPPDAPVDPMLLLALPEVPPGLDDCMQYVATMRRFLDCAKAPASMRLQFRQGVDRMATVWAGDLPDSARASMNANCRNGIDTLRRAQQVMGCEK